MTNEHDIALTAAFLMDGIRDTNYTLCLKRWGNGCLELIQDLTWFADLLVSMRDICAEEVEGNYSGVFEYEVVAPFGKWYGEFVIINEQAPEILECQQWIYAQLCYFFGKEMNGDTGEALELYLKTNTIKIGVHTWQI